MSNNIFHVVLKHKIYEWCIDIIFRHIFRNFPSKAVRIPEVGEKYVFIQHLDVNETYFNCTVIDPSELADYELLDSSERLDFKFAISFKRSLYRSDEGEEIEIYNEDDKNKDEDDGYQYFITDDMKHLIFKQ